MSYLKKGFIFSLSFFCVVSIVRAKEGPYKTAIDCIQKTKAAFVFGDISKDIRDKKAAENALSFSAFSKALESDEFFNHFDKVPFTNHVSFSVPNEDFDYISKLEERVLKGHKLTESEKKEMFRILKDTYKASVEKSGDYEFFYRDEFHGDLSLRGGYCYFVNDDGNIYKSDATDLLRRALKQNAPGVVFSLILPNSNKKTLLAAENSDGRFDVRELYSTGPFVKGVLEMNLETPKLANNERSVFLNYFSDELQQAVGIANGFIPSSTYSVTDVNSAMKSALRFCKETVKDAVLQKTIDNALVHLDKKTRFFESIEGNGSSNNTPKKSH